jgi:HPt (histidine-containing phosphotransfer) domain-containing protein
MPKLRQLYDLGIDDVEKRLARMRDAAALGHLDTVRREAHAIKGSCGMVGALELQTLASAIEDGTTFEASAMAQMPHACLRLRRTLDAKLQIV